MTNEFLIFYRHELDYLDLIFNFINLQKLYLYNVVKKILEKK